MIIIRGRTVTREGVCICVTALSTPPPYARARTHPPQRPQYSRVGMINSGPVAGGSIPSLFSLSVSPSLPPRTPLHLSLSLSSPQTQNYIRQLIPACPSIPHRPCRRISTQITADGPFYHRGIYSEERS